MLDTAGSVQGSQPSNRHRVAAFGSTSPFSVSSGYPLLARTTLPASQTASGSGASTLPRTPSNSATSPTPTPGPMEQSFSPSGRRAAQTSLSTEEGSGPNFDDPPRDRSLPRIIPVEGSEEGFFRGSLHPAAPEAAHQRDRDSLRTNTRRTNRAPAPFIHKNTSISSMSSNLSFGTSASSVYTPGTPIDEPRTQRITEASRTTLTNLRRLGDLDQRPRPILPPLPSYPPPLYQTFVSFQTRTGVLSPMNNVTNDIPQERRSLQDLFLTDSGLVRTDSRHDLEGQPQGYGQGPQPNSYSLPPTTRSGPEKSPLFSCEQFDETDPLSILAYAGRMLDEQAHKPP